MNELRPIYHRQLASFLSFFFFFFFLFLDQTSKLGEPGEIIFVLSGQIIACPSEFVDDETKCEFGERCGARVNESEAVIDLVGRLNIQELSFWLLSKPPSIFWWIFLSFYRYIYIHTHTYIYIVYMCVFLTSESRSRASSQNIEHNSTVEGPRGAAVQVAVVSSINRQRATEPTHILTDSRIIRLVSPSISSARETRSDPSASSTTPPIPTLTDVDATTPTK